MEICVVSDLHVDHPQLAIQWPKADVLVISGDIANTIGDELKVLRKVSKLYSHVVAIDGNHTHYSNANRGRTVEETIERICGQLPPNVHYLGHHNPRVLIDDVHFVGCNGWYSFDASGDPIENRVKWKHTMNDDRWIGFSKILQKQPWDRAEDDARLMRETLQEIADDETDRPVRRAIVALTHTAPHRDMVAWTADPNWNRSNSFYVNLRMQEVLESDLARAVTTWVHGHTHFRKDRTINGIYCVCNPRGYPGENPAWEPVVIPIIK